MSSPTPKISPEAIAIVLATRRERFAKLLQINPNDQEWQQAAEAQPPGSNLSTTQWVVEQRKRGSSRGQLVARIDLALEEIAGALHLYGLLWHAVNRGPGIGAVRRALKAISADPTPYIDGTQELDHVTLAWLDSHYPGGWIAMETQPLQGPALQRAAQQALSDIPARARGRPEGRKDTAVSVLGPQLAQIYGSYAEQNPTRRVDPNSHEVYGPFKAFVTEVMSVLTGEFRTTAKGGLKGVDHIVRLGIDSLTRKNRKSGKAKPAK